MRIVHWWSLFLAKTYSRIASRIREYAKTEGLMVDWLGKRAVPSPKTMITFRTPQIGFSVTMDFDCSGSNRNDGIKPDPTASNAINVAVVAVAGVLCPFKRAKLGEDRRNISMRNIII